MSAIEFLCTCGQVLRSGPDRAGKKVRCPTCSSVQVVPDSSAPAARPGAPDPFAGVENESFKPAATQKAGGGSASVFMTGVYDAVHDSNDMMAPLGKANGAKRTVPPGPLMAPAAKAPVREAPEMMPPGQPGDPMRPPAVLPARKAGSSAMPKMEDINPDALFGGLPPPATSDSSANRMAPVAPNRMGTGGSGVTPSAAGRQFAGEHDSTEDTVSLPPYSDTAPHMAPVPAPNNLNAILFFAGAVLILIAVVVLVIFGRS